MSFWDYVVMFILVDLPAILAFIQSLRNADKIDEARNEMQVVHDSLMARLDRNAVAHDQRADAGDARVDSLEHDLEGKQDKKTPPHKPGHGIKG